MTANHLIKIIAAISFQLIVLGMKLILGLVVFGFTLFRRLRLNRISFKSSPVRVVHE